jgi:Zn-finger nucleic acid-binding protein
MADYEVSTITKKMSYDVCEACGGLWLDKGELDKMAFQVEGDIEYCSKDEAKGETTTKHCPRCAGKHLYKAMFLGDDAIVLERCNNCNGFWLEGGQLEKIDDDLAKTMTIKGKGFSEFLTGVHLPHYAKRIKR